MSNFTSIVCLASLIWYICTFMCFSFILHIHLFLSIFCVQKPEDILGQFVFMYLSHLKFFWRVADVKSISRVINLSFHPVTLCTHLSCWPLKFIFFKIRLLFLLPSFSSISWALSHLVSIPSPCHPCLSPFHVSVQ